MFSAPAFLDLDQTDHTALFRTGAGQEESRVWNALPRIGEHLGQLLLDTRDRLSGDVHEGATVGPQVVVSRGAVVEAHAVIKGPAWIGPGTTVRSGAYVRENVIVGNHCVLGNSSEFKNCILFNHCEAPHFNYVGDSILGFKAHLGAGVICSNVRLDRQSIRVRTGGNEQWIETGLRKFGAVIGDYSEVGCHSVLSPGSILGRHCIVHPCIHWRGTLPANRIVRNRGEWEVMVREGEF